MVEVQLVKWRVSWEAGFIFEATGGGIYQCCVRSVLLHCCETWELTVVDEASLRGVERRMINMMCGVRLVNRVSTDVLQDKVGLLMKIEY